MISGPTTVRMRMGLREFVRQRTELLESGLLLVQEDLDLGGGAGGSCIVDALARDALGTPTFVFAAETEAARELPNRILEVDGWFRRHGDSLLRALADAGYKNGAQPRFLVIAFDLEAELIGRFERLGVQRLEVLQICSFVLRGDLHYDVEYVLPRDAAREVRNGMLPSLLDAHERELCACLLDLLQRIDPRVAIGGDRFSRRFTLGGVSLCVLRYDEAGLSVTIGEQTLEILSWDHVVDAVDLVLRSWHLGVREPGAKDAASKDPDAAPTQANGADAPRPTVPPFARSQRISLEALRRSVAESRLTREEFSALGRQAPESEAM